MEWMVLQILDNMFSSFCRASLSKHIQLLLLEHNKQRFGRASIPIYYALTSEAAIFLMLLVPKEKTNKLSFAFAT